MTFPSGTDVMSTSKTEASGPAWCASLAAISCIKAAFDTGLWDKLLRADSAGFQTTQQSFSMIFWHTLADLGLGAISGDRFIPHPTAIADLATAENQIKIEFQAKAAADLLEHGAFFLSKDGDIPDNSRVFLFFNYSDAVAAHPRAPEKVAAWVDYLAYCSVRENDALADAVFLPQWSRILEIGGNVGLFAAALLERNSTAQAVVFDLPAVVAEAARFPPPPAVADRLNFAPGDLRFDALPLVNGQAPNVVLFKSVLHDWPDVAAREILVEAIDHLSPGGIVLIAERNDASFDTLPLSLENAHNHAFTRFYRASAWYAEAARGKAKELGVCDVDADTGFFILCLVKPSEGATL